MNNLFLDIHILQTVPPSCVNRDDTGSPKAAIYGGVTRARVSSQSWKHAMRNYFYEHMAKESVGIRTKRICALVAEELQNLGITNAEKAAEEALGNVLSIKSFEKGTEALFFISRPQARALAKLKAEKSTDKEAYKKALKDNPSLDIALFGRMVADDASLNIDATAQVAHAISTHAVQTEFDYFTAVDDMRPEDTAGAGHLGTVEFNSSTLYRYATLNVAKLRDYLGEDTKEAVKIFIDAFVRSMPTGKQNTFANRTLPNCVYVTLRRDQPVNMVGAFEKPITTREGGYVTNSIKALAEYAKTLGDYVEEPEAAFSVGGSMESLAPTMKLSELIEAVANHLD